MIAHSGQIAAAIGNAFPTSMVSIDDREYQVEILKGGARSLMERIEGPFHTRRR
ncbi:MAG: hypothetical protein PPHEMADM_5749 [uncultured Paraburkholderia sp.]|nr:MAG: hypothetical protein PPHEMADE_5765 [uncultured Paraburkholderia sp.]CAH2946093.1 MAG: hypothetical protein PPHEMADM_5749 [uncultured Paraburkholderia sp.]